MEKPKHETDFQEKCQKLVFPQTPAHCNNKYFRTRHKTRVLQVTKTIGLFMYGKKKKNVKNLGRTMGQ